MEKRGGTQELGGPSSASRNKPRPSIVVRFSHPSFHFPPLITLDPNTSSSRNDDDNGGSSNDDDDDASSSSNKDDDDGGGYSSSRIDQNDDASSSSHCCNEDEDDGGYSCNNEDDDDGCCCCCNDDSGRREETARGGKLKRGRRRRRRPGEGEQPKQQRRRHNKMWPRLPNPGVTNHNEAYATRETRYKGDEQRGGNTTPASQIPTTAHNTRTRPVYEEAWGSTAALLLHFLNIYFMY